MLPNRYENGRVIHWGPGRSYSVGAPDQCEYNGCRSTKAAHSTRCSRHS